MFQFFLDSTNNVSENLNNTLSLTNSVSYTIIRPLSLSNTLILSHSVIELSVFKRTNLQTLSFVQGVSSTNNLSNTIVQPLSLTHSLDRQVLFSRNINQSLSLSQSIFLNKILNLHINQSLSFTHLIILDVKLHVNSILNLTQSVSFGSIRSISLTSQLIFNEPYFPKQTQLNNTILMLPNVQYFIVLKKYCVRLRKDSRSILLPCPNFGDSESNLSSIVTKRTMTGRLYSYTKKTTNRKIKYTFTLDRPKSLELRSFLIDHLTDLITLENWKGEQWISYITNNPPSIIPQSLNERCDVSLEFTGTRIN